jgi:hypothetical protein
MGNFWNDTSWIITGTAGIDACGDLKEVREAGSHRL